MSMDRRGFLTALGAVAVSAAVPAVVVPTWEHRTVALGYSVDGVALQSAMHPLAASFARTKEICAAKLFNDLFYDIDDSALVACEFDTDKVNQNGLRLCNAV